MPTEPVLHIPPQLTKSAYQILLATNSAPRPWHLEGRFGSRSHVVHHKITNGIPILFDAQSMDKLASSSPPLKELLHTDGVEIVHKEFIRNSRTKLGRPSLDARVHPEREPSDYVTPPIVVVKDIRKPNSLRPLFTYAEIFGGIGGFGVALEALGGSCVFYSEIDPRCRETYALNFNTPNECIHGDIYNVPDSTFPKHLDILVAGFPCQPFSKLGDQPGLECPKGRGHLFLQLVRALELSKPKAFLFENVPGLLEMNHVLTCIVDSFCAAGYKVNAEICSARGLTATKRNRLFFVGIRHDLVPSHVTDNTCDYAADDKTKQQLGYSSFFDTTFFQFPFIPDLKLCAHDILDYETLPQDELDILRLSISAFEQLTQSKRWRPHHLAWPNNHCYPLTSHYGNAVGRGGSQLVPSSSPHTPRRFSIRECARLMGFPNSFVFCQRLMSESQGEMAYRKEIYRMLGNAVCPPLIAALAGSVLDVALQKQLNVGETHDGYSPNEWIIRGRNVAVDLACAALRSERVPLPPGCISETDTAV